MPRKEKEPEFHIIPPLIKFGSSPARWTVKISLLSCERPLTATVDTEVLTWWPDFSNAFLEQSNVLLPDIRNTQWKAMLRDAGAPEIRETPKESTPEGAIETALEEFLDEAKENVDLGYLKAFPGFDEDSQYFKYQTFDAFCKRQGQRFQKALTMDVLQHLGFRQKPRRFGLTVVKLWTRPFAEKGDSAT